jgi:flagellar biosynthesis protein FlhG
MTSATGGTGKSTLTWAFAKSLASRGVRVACVDADLTYPTLDLIFGDLPTGGSSTAGESIYRSQEVTLVVNRSGFGKQRGYLENRLPELLDQLATQHDVCLIDVPAARDGASLEALGIAHQTLCVATSDPACLTSTAMLLQEARRREADAGLSLLMNRIETVESGEFAWNVLDQAFRKRYGLAVDLCGLIRAYRGQPGVVFWREVERTVEGLMPASVSRRAA